MEEKCVNISCIIRKPFGNKYISMIAIASLILIAVTLPVNAAIQATSVEIRGEVYDVSPLHVPNAIGCVPTCAASWNGNNFAGFWYDLKDGLMSEDLTISTLGASSIATDKLLYNATIRAVQFKVGSEVNKIVENGLGGSNKLTKDGSIGSDGMNLVVGGQYYAKIGWQAEEYVALNAKANKLAKLVFEQIETDKKTLTIGEVWDIRDGYTLIAQSIDTSTSPRQVWLSLSKDGVKLDDKIVVQGQVYTYTRNSLAGETDVPIFVTYVDSVFAGATTDIIQLKYTWVVSTSVTEIKTGDKYGVMDVMDDGASSGTIKLQNKDSAVSLSRNSVVDIMGNMKFSIADSATLRFMPIITRTTPGIHVKRGEVVDAATSHYPNATGCLPACAAGWNAYNFAGFWYDLKDGLMSEDMTITTIGANSIAADKLFYNAAVRAVQFKVNSEKRLIIENGLDSSLVKDRVIGTDGQNNVTGGQYYAKIGWQAEEYVALNGKANKLAKIVYEQTSTDKKTLTIDDVWDIGDGYTLSVQSINASTSPGQAWLALSKDGVKLDDKIIVQGQAYTYTKASLASETDVPIFVTYVDSVFPGATTDILQLKYTWVVSTSVTEIKTSDKYGVMEVMDDGASDHTINLMNKDSAVSLSRNSVVDIMGNMKFAVADSTTLRFMPIVEYEIVGEGGVVTPGGGFQDTLIFEPKEWNLVSVPRTLVNPAVDLGLVNLSFDSNNIKWGYNATGNAWEHPLNILPLRGYWVYNNASAQIFQKLNYQSMTGPMVPPSMKLRAGWNLIGHTSTQSMPVESALISINGKYSHLLSYSPIGGWKMYIVGNPNLQQFNSFEPGRGYWIFMIQDADYAAVEI